MNSIADNDPIPALPLRLPLPPVNPILFLAQLLINQAFSKSYRLHE